MSGKKYNQRRQEANRRVRTTRHTPHAFMPQSGHTHLCVICNCEQDEQFKGHYIHLCKTIKE